MNPPGAPGRDWKSSRPGWPGRRKQGRVRVIFAGCKRAALAGVALLAPAIASCSASIHTLHVSEPVLEVAPEAVTRELGRALVTNPAPIERLYQPLGQRMGLCQIRTNADWDLLRRAIPQLGPSPDLSRGIAIAVISRAGQPLSG